MFKTIPNFSNYEVSICGKKIRNKKTGKLFEPSAKSGPYINTTLISDDLKKKTVYIHRLVASSYIPNPQNKPEVNHIDGIQTNNSVSNLEWVTRQENSDHAWANGLKQGLIDHNKNRDISHYQKMGRANRGYTDDEIRFMRNTFQNKTMTQKELATKFNTTVSNMGRMLRRERYTDVV